AAAPGRLGEQAEALLIVLQRLRRAAEQVMDRGARGALVRGDLGQRPIAAQVEVDHLPLMLREKRTVALVQGERAAASLQGVKCHSLTVYQQLNCGHMDDIWRDALLYNRWANLQILDDCSTLEEEQLRLTTPGAYGSIADMLQHLLSAEQRYVRRLTGAETTLHE